MSLGIRRDLWHFQQSQHDDGCILLARYDFLLVFNSHSRSVVKQLQARKSVSLIRASKRRNVFSFVLHAFSALTLLVECQQEHPACKYWVTRCWCGYLSGARCRLFTYGPADATAIPKPHYLLPRLNPDCFTFLVPAYPSCPRKEAVKQVCVLLFLHLSLRLLPLSSSITRSFSHSPLRTYFHRSFPLLTLFLFDPQTLQSHRHFWTHRFLFPGFISFYLFCLFSSLRAVDWASFGQLLRAC